MRTSTHPLSKDLVLVGGGHAHALFLRKWAMYPLPGARVTLINLSPTSPYTGMLPGYVAGHYQLDELNMDLVRLAQFAGIRFVLDEVTNVDLAKQRVLRKNGPAIYFDILSLDIGITLALETVEGFAEFGISAKPMDQFAQRWNDFLGVVKENEITPKIVVLGGGVGGVELALAMKYRLQGLGSVKSSVAIVEQENDILGEVEASARKKLRKHLDSFGIEVVCNNSAARIHADRVDLSTGISLPANFVVGTAGANPFEWIQDIGLPCDKGFITVDSYLKSPANPSIFAVGDCAAFKENPLPKAGVYAVRQAPILYHNLKASLAGKKLVPFRPQKDFLKLISTGKKNAVGLKLGISFEGSSIWSFKDFIDKKFMNKFVLEIPAPTIDTPPEAALESNEILQESKVLCGGCGAKVTHSSLQSVLQEFTSSNSEFNPDAAEIKLGAESLVVSTDHLRSFIGDHALFARITALHSMSDVWAKGATPLYALASITIPRMSETLQRETLREIMDSSTKTFEENGGQIIGGHTTQGAELTIGFTVMGHSAKSYASHVGAQPGHLLILTKPLGTGVILAGLMQGKVSGETLYRALGIMDQSSDLASKTLTPLVSSMTDVTGFGLAGHLHNILVSSKVGASLSTAAIPTIKGAMELSDTGIRSTLWQSNSNIPLDVKTDSEASNFNLLFDPQTSGGLLATISEKNLESLQQKAKKMEFGIYPIGKITAGQPVIAVY